MAFTPEERQEIRDIMKSQSRDVSLAPIITEVDGSTSLPIVTSQNKVARVTIDQLRQGLKVQSDMAENDPENPAYIKNRTHYVNGREAIWTSFVSLSGHYGTSEGNAGIVIGKRYDVEINVGGVTYSYTALLPKTDDEAHYYLSEGWDIFASPMNPTQDDSFYVWNVDNTIYVGVSFLQNTEAQVTIYDADVKRLDRQYMPDGVAWEVTQADIDEITGK